MVRGLSCELRQRYDAWLWAVKKKCRFCLSLFLPLFENVFHDNICLERDFPEYLADNADYWVESSVMKDLVKEEFNMWTSLLLPHITPDSDGKTQLTVVNKLVNDARSDHGWYM